MKLLLWAALALIAVWMFAWAALKVTGFVTHLVLLAGLVLLATAALRLGFRRTRARVAAARHSRSGRRYV